MSSKIVIVSNMYPRDNEPFFGVFVERSVSAYREQGLDVEVISTRSNGFLGYFIFYINVVLKLLCREVDVVHVHFVSHSVLPVLIAKLFKRKMKVIINFHGSDVVPRADENIFRVKIKQSICCIAVIISECVVVPTEYFKRVIIELFGKRYGSKIIVSPSGGVNELDFKYKFNGGNRVLFAGRLVEEKGVKLAIAAVKKLQLPLNDVKFVGDGPLRDNVDKLFGDHSGSVKHMIAPSELALEMALHDVFLFPSQRESLGLVLVEAVFSGMIPVVYRNGAAEEVIPLELHSLLIANSENEYVDKLRVILNLPVKEKAQLSSTLFSSMRDRYSSKASNSKLILDLSGRGIIQL